MKSINSKLAYFVFFLTLGISTNLQATIYQTVKNGSWKSKTVWSPSKPNMSWGFNDTIRINHTVNMNLNLTVFGRLEITANGALSSNSKSITTKGNSVFVNNGTLYCKEFTADWGNTYVENNGVFTVKSEMELNENNFVNNGTVLVKGEFTNNTNSLITNNLNAIFTVNDEATNKSKIVNAGSLVFKDKYETSWSDSLLNSGTIDFQDKVENKGFMQNTGTITVSDEFESDYSSVINNSGNFTVSDKFENKGTITNSGTLTVNDKFENKYNINNYNTINIADDLTNEYHTIVNNGVINVVKDLENKGTITNDGGLYVDGAVTLNSGNITGSGDLCNTDGVTDPTAGAKGVTCDVCGGEGSTLPVNLVSFQAEANNGMVKISWATASEVNNDYFEVLRSVDGSNFESIGQVQGNGNSNVLLSYELTDENPASGINYYMLKQVDFDGTTVNSNIVEVENTLSLEAKLYPNPIRSGNNLNIKLSEMGHKTIEVYNVSGQLVRSIETEEMDAQINTNQLVKGMYIVRIIWNTNMLTEKIQIR